MTTAAIHPVPDLHGANLFDGDPDLGALLSLYLPAAMLQHLMPHLRHLGGLAGGVLDTLAHTADKNPPELVHRTRSGVDAQRIVKHPAYVEMERVAFSQYGLAAMSHRAGVLGWDTPLPAAAKYALTYLFVQAEFGLCCPLSMTDSLTRTLCKFGSPELIDRYLPQLTTQVFDELYQGAMFITEQDAGSDVGAVTTQAPLRGRRCGGSPATNGSAPIPTPIWRWCWRDPRAAPAGTKGLSLFLLPRRLEDGSLNSLSHRPAEAEARHALDGERRDRARTARSPISSASRRPASSR